MAPKKIKMIIAGAMITGWVIFIIVASVLFKRVPPLVFVLLGIFMVLDLLIISVIMRKPKPCEQLSNGTLQSDSTPYSDSLISIDDNGLTIQLYYFPVGSKRVNFSDIEKVEAYKGGNMRLWGSNDFRTWFGLDNQRMHREMTFIIKQRNKWSRVGFTCEDSKRVANILRSKTIFEVR